LDDDGLVKVLCEFVIKSKREMAFLSRHPVDRAQEIEVPCSKLQGIFYPNGFGRVRSMQRVTATAFPALAPNRMTARA
jgi:hypothetical protein